LWHAEILIVAQQSSDSVIVSNPLFAICQPCRTIEELSGNNLDR
jgi:hypothetical protein